MLIESQCFQNYAGTEGEVQEMTEDDPGDEPGPGGQ